MAVHEDMLQREAKCWLSKEPRRESRDHQRGETFVQESLSSREVEEKLQLPLTEILLAFFISKFLMK